MLYLRQGLDLSSRFGIVDLFAGPGGLGEGFASLVDGGQTPYRIGLSVENETAAHRTLVLRAFLRRYRQRCGDLPHQFIEFHAGRTNEPDWEDVDAESWRCAVEEARRLELGDERDSAEIDQAIKKTRQEFDDTILIGGPPCQAYSLIGRARSNGQLNYVPENDKRHYLFREYLGILSKLCPAAFVMENVKGMLSSTVESRLVFEMLMDDLSLIKTDCGARYELRAISVDDCKGKFSEASQPSDFVVRAEALGVPQRRHRVFVIGLRTDIAAGGADASVSVRPVRRSISDAIGDLAPLRSGLSRRTDNPDEWRSVVVDAADRLAMLHASPGNEEFCIRFSETAQKLREGVTPARSDRTLPSCYGSSQDDFKEWIENPSLRAIAQHETRSHMESDLSRYLFAAVFGYIVGESPKSNQFPPALSPAHRNWQTGAFADRFRVQLAKKASTTITSHISKDGHYFIHHDPVQCRSLTVREAARLQSFPDDYLFLGNRTQQYVQVGNAVPPYLARIIALLLLRTLEGECEETDGRSSEASCAEMA